MAGPDLTGTPGVTDETGQPDLAAMLAALQEQVTGLLNAPGAFPAGFIGYTTGSDPPAGWLIADGSTFDVNVYAQLATIHPSGVLPDLRDRFVVGAGLTYDLLEVGGAATVTLTGAQSGVAAHMHTLGAATGSTTPGASGSTTPGNTGGEASHTHGIAHTHQISISSSAGGTTPAAPGVGGQAATFTSGAASDATSDPGTSHTHTSAAHTHTGAAHTHTLPDTDNVAAANAAQAHTNLPPYFGLTPLIHI